jgi:hypothetical protein
MADQVCDNCFRLFEDGDEVKAVVLSTFKALKSKRIYAIAPPTACLELIHKNCQHPQGGYDEEG